MKPASFEYYVPDTVAEAVDLLARCNGEARLLAGGQSLVPMMNFRLATPAVIIDLNHIESLNFIRRQHEAVLIGAMTRQRTLEFSDLIRDAVPLLYEGLKHVGHLATRSRGTIGGSLAHADPAAEIPMVLCALDASVTVRGPRGERIIALPDLFVGVMTTLLEPDEILTEVKVPVMARGAGFAVEEFSRRHGDFAIAAIAAVMTRNADKGLGVRLTTGGVSAVPDRLEAAERLLESEGLSDASIRRAADAAAESVEPLSDRNGSSDYRRELTRTLVQRAVTAAAARLKGH